MAYAMISKKSSESMARMCNEGCCPVKNSVFICPFLCSWPETASERDKVTAEMWNDLIVREILSPEEQRKRDREYNLSRKACVENLLKRVKPGDMINRMSLEGELKEIERLLAEDSA
jgi:hypothetical protein